MPAEMKANWNMAIEDHKEYADRMLFSPNVIVVANSIIALASPFNRPIFTTKR